MPVAQAAVGLVRGCGVNELTVVVTVLMTGGGAVSLLSGDPRLLMARESGGTGVFGLCLLGSLAREPAHQTALPEPDNGRTAVPRGDDIDRMSRATTSRRLEGTTDDRFPPVWLFHRVQRAMDDGRWAEVRLAETRQSSDLSLDRGK